MSCREGTLYNSAVMTCDHATNVNCFNKVRVSKPIKDIVSNHVDHDHDDDVSDHVYSHVSDDNIIRLSEEEGLSSEKIAIIVLVILLLAVCLLLSWCFRERIKVVAEPYLDSLKSDKLKAPAPFGVFKPSSLSRFSWSDMVKTDQNKNVTSVVIPAIPKAQIRTSHHANRDLPPLPTTISIISSPSAVSSSDAPVPPPRHRRKSISSNVSVVEIQHFQRESSPENSQSIA